SGEGSGISLMGRSPSGGDGDGGSFLGLRRQVEQPGAHGAEDGAEREAEQEAERGGHRWLVSRRQGSQTRSGRSCGWSWAPQRMQVGTRVARGSFAGAGGVKSAGLGGSVIACPPRRGRWA